MSYIKPEDVRSPKSRWYLFEVLLDNGPGKCAYALGEWEKSRVIAFRWNGTDENNKIGNPQSRGQPTWIVLDDAIYKPVIELLPKERQEVARGFLGMKQETSA